MPLTFATLYTVGIREIKCGRNAVGICNRSGQLLSLCKNINYVSLDVRALVFILSCQGGLADQT